MHPQKQPPEVRTLARVPTAGDRRSGDSNSHWASQCTRFPQPHDWPNSPLNVSALGYSKGGRVSPTLESCRSPRPLMFSLPLSVTQFSFAATSPSKTTLRIPRKPSGEDSQGSQCPTRDPRWRKRACLHPSPGGHRSPSQRSVLESRAWEQTFKKSAFRLYIAFSSLLWDPKSHQTPQTV